MSDEPITFQNDNISVSVTRKPACKVEFLVTVSPKEAQALYEKATKNVNKEVSFPGFRKGKVPNAVILKHFKPQVESEWRELLMNVVFTEAVRLTKIFPFNRSQERSVTADYQTISLETGATLTYSFETNPDIPTINPQDFSAPVVSLKEIKEKDIEKTLEDLRLQKAEWTKVEDRPVVYGDFIDVDIDVISEPTRHICSNARERVDSEYMEKWIQDLVIGITPGQTVEGSNPKHEDCSACTTEEEHVHEHKAETFQIKLNAIYEAKLPELDDAFAVGYGATDLADMKAKIEKQFNRQAEQEQLSAIHTQLKADIEKKYPFEIPQSLVESQLRSYFNNMLSGSTASDTEHQAAVKGWFNDNKADLEDTARKQIQSHLLFQQAGIDQKITILEEEVNQVVLFRTYMLKYSNPNAETPTKQEVYQELFMGRVLDALLQSMPSLKI